MHKENNEHTLEDNSFVDYFKFETTIPDIKQKISNILKTFYLTDFSFVRVCGDEINYQISTLPEGLIHEYFDKSFHKYDLMVEFAQQFDNQPTFQSHVYDQINTFNFESETLSKNKEIITLNRKYGFYDLFFMRHTSIDQSSQKCCHVLFSVTQRYLQTKEIQKIVAPISHDLIMLCEAIDYVTVINSTVTKQEEYDDSSISLQPIETEILRQLRAGKTPKEIAFELGYTQNNIYQKLYRVRSKLGAKTTTEAVTEANKQQDFH